MPDLLDAAGVLTGRGKKVLPTGDGLPEGGQTSIFTPDMTPTEIADTATAAADMAIAAAEAAASAVLASEPIVTAISEAATAATNIADVITNDGSTVAGTGSSSMFSGNPYSAAGGPGYGIPYSSTNVYVTVEGSAIVQDELVKVVNDAVITANSNGYNNYRPGALDPALL